jgi:hypothetical protein
MVRDTCMSCGGVYMIICLLSGVLLGQLGAAGADRRNDKRQTMNVGGVWASIWGKSDRLSAAPSMVPSGPRAFPKSTIHNRFIYDYLNDTRTSLRARNRYSGDTSGW